MNCMEAQALVEDVLDNALAGCRKRALDLHLSRCDDCRAFFDAERNEHRRWFQAMNDPESLHRLPNGFADQFAAEMIRMHAAPKRKWELVRAFRRIAAALAAMLFFGGLSYAAVNGLRQMEPANQDETEDATDVTGETAVASDAPVPAEHIDASVPQSGRARSPSAPNQESQSTIQGATTMTGRKAAAAALTAALAATPLAAANGDEYQFILSGDPVAAETVGTSSLTSNEDVALDALFNSVRTTAGGSLYSTEGGFIMTFR